MSLRLKLIGIVLLVALVPLAISAWTMLTVHQRAFEARTTELHRKGADYGASTLQEYLDRTRSSVSQAVRAIDWAELTAEERTGALWLILRQVDPVAVVSLLGEDGQGVGPSAYLEPGAPDDPELAGRPRAPRRLLEAFSQRIPFAEAHAGRFAFGRLFTAEGLGAPLLPIAVPVPGPKRARWVVAAALSLEPLCGAIARAGTSHASAFLLGSDGEVVCRPGAGPLSTAEPSLLAALKAPALPGALARFTSAKGEPHIAALATSSSGWAMVVEQPASTAFAANSRMRLQTLLLLAVAFALALGTGTVVSRGILRPVGKLLDGARQIATGRFDLRLRVESADELGQLSRAFNEMGVAVEERDREIRALNEGLQQRVEQRTRELREAQDQLLHSQKMAAVTGLGAGFAHEINNPLTAVIGLAQVLLRRAKQRGRAEEVEVLGHVIGEAHRIRKTVRTLLSLSQNLGCESYAELEVNALVGESLSLLEPKLAEAKVEIVRRLQDGVPRIRGNKAQLREVLVNVFNNSRAAMLPAGGKLVVSTGAIAGQVVRIEIHDTGRGIAPEHLEKIFDPFFTTKDEWRSEGLGLTVASRVVEQHKGRIQVQSEVGRGTTLTITLPAAPRAHLA